MKYLGYLICSNLSVAELAVGPVSRGFLYLVKDILGEKVKDFILVHLVLGSLPTSVLRKLLDCLFVVGPEAIKLLDILGLVLFEVEESCGVLFRRMIRVAKVVE